MLSFLYCFVVKGKLIDKVITPFITARAAKRAKVMFSQACVAHSVQLRGEVGNTNGQPPSPGTRSQHPPPRTRSQHPLLLPPPDQVTTPPPPRTRSQHPPGLWAGGRYTSYWNAFLFFVIILVYSDCKW